MAHYIGFDCVKCGACKETCPVEAISEGYTRCIVDQNKCVDCGTCEGVCPTGAISASEESTSSVVKSSSSYSSKGIPFFFDAAPDEKEGIDVLVTEGDNGKWIGRGLTISDDEGDTFKYSFYILPIDDDSALLFCPFGESKWLSDFVSDLDDNVIGGARRAWPLLMAALKNGENDNYSHPAAPALIHVEDAPTGESNIWGVAVKVENIDYENIDTKYLYSRAIFASQYAIRMLIEYRENDISTIDQAITVGKQGYGAWRTWKTIANISSIALSLLGGISLPFGDDA